MTTPALVAGRHPDQSTCEAMAWATSEQWAKPGTELRFGLLTEDYSWPDHDGTDAPLVPTWRSPAHWFQPAYYPNPSWPARTPWRTPWMTGTGGDQGVIVNTPTEQDPRAGITALNLRPPNPIEAAWLWFATGFRFRAGDLVADAYATHTTANYYRVAERGAGNIPKPEGIVRVSEVIAGWIGHVLAIAAPNIERGPGARFVAPASRVEHPEAVQTYSPLALPAGPHPRMAPHGDGWALDWSDADIARWVDAQGSRHEGFRHLQTVLARAMCEYGWRYVETGSRWASIETNGRYSDDGHLWASELGVVDANAASRVCAGLPIRSRCYRLNPVAAA